MSKFEIRQTDKGQGVFTRDAIAKGEFITEWRGAIVHGKDLPHPYHANLDLFTQISNDAFVGPSGDIDDLINHSCDPNCGMRFEENRIFLIAIRNISSNEELNWDYATTMNTRGITYLDDWEMRCLCKSPRCRGIVKSFEHVPPTVQHEYTQLGIVPEYVIKSIV